MLDETIKFIAFLFTSLFLIDYAYRCNIDTTKYIFIMFNLNTVLVTVSSIMSQLAKTPFKTPIKISHASRIRYLFVNFNQIFFQKFKLNFNKL